jgi:hypothetical protein
MDEIQLTATLQAMQDDPSFITQTAYRANTVLWPENTITFIDIHLAYLRAHPKVDTSIYISNLRLRLRKRG